jgi:phosphatidate phosphatase APP1
MVDAFLDKFRFPRGSIHMRYIRTLTSRDWFKSTEDGKYEMICKIIEDFPWRQFILIGDSGERDPQIYTKILQSYPNQILLVCIRDIASSRLLNKKRELLLKTSNKTGLEIDVLQSHIDRARSMNHVLTNYEKELCAEIDQIDSQLHQVEYHLIKIFSSINEDKWCLFEDPDQLRRHPKIMNMLASLERKQRRNSDVSCT